MIETFLLITGVLLLVTGAYVTIEGVIAIANSFRISKTIIGLSVISVGTSLPEIATNIKSGLIGADGIAIGTVIGSDIAQTTLLVGIIALLTKVYVTKEMLKRDGAMMMLSIILLFLVSFTSYNIAWYEGLFLLILYMGYLYSMMRDDKVISKVREVAENNEDILGAHKNNLFNFILIVIGIVLLVYASDIVVKNALILAQAWHVKESFIGVMIIGIGTALPELATAVMGVVRKQPSISIGTLIGSNITDPMLSLSLGAIAAGTAGLTIVPNLIFFDIPFWFCVSIIALFLFRQTIAQEKRRRVNGVILISFYFLFIILKLVFFLH